MLGTAHAAPAFLKNESYRLTLQADNSVTVEATGVPAQTLVPEFTVLFSPTDPGYDHNHLNYYLAPRLAVRWPKYQEDAALLNQRLNTPLMRAVLRHSVEVKDDGQGRHWLYRDEDGKTALEVSGPYAEGTTNPFAAGKKFILKATGAEIRGETIFWSFPEQAGFLFQAEITLPSGQADPQITLHLTPKQEGYYSAGFTGAPALAHTLKIPEECSENNLKADYLLCEADLSLPRAQLSVPGWSEAVVVDPAEAFFRLPDFTNSRFGLMLRREGEALRPLALSPILGGPESLMRAGQPYHFSVRYVLHGGDWMETYRHIARALYRFHDQRDNSGPGSLNGTLERVVDYLVDRNGHNYALWDDEQKYYDYWNDNSGTLLPFSPLFGLSAAVVTDDEEFYRKRVRPQVEFAVSRRNNTFLPYDDTPSPHMVSTRKRLLGAPYPTTVELLSMAAFFQNRTYAFSALAQEKGFAPNEFPTLLARYELSHDPADLQQAEKIADASLARVLSSTGYAYMDYLDLYEITHEARYLQAAVEGAYSASTQMNLSPPVPDTPMKIDVGNVAPIHRHSFSRHLLYGFPPPLPFPAPEQTVPAWRVALTGIIQDTYRADFWMNQEGHFMRLARLADDDFLRTLGRWGMVGRFGNYPGDNRSLYSLVQEQPDLPEHPIWQLDFTTLNPGHAWEFAAEVIDFLVSDAFDRSEGQIDFPSRSMYGSQFRVRLYGDRPGRFYDESNVRLWLPRHLLTSDNKQIDYLAGYGNGKLYLAFWNQSFQPQTAKITLNPERVPMQGRHEAKKWEGNRPAGTVSVSGNTLAFTIPAKGIIAYAIDGVTAKTGLQAKMLDASLPPLGPQSRVVTPAPFGAVHAMLISMGRGLTTSYVYSEGGPEEILSAKLRYRQGQGAWRELSDKIFPYEFTTDFADGQGPLQLVFEAETLRNGMQKTPVIILTP